MEMLDTVALHSFAANHHTEGRLVDAERIYQTLLRIDPCDHVTLHALGVIAYQNGDNKSASDFINAAIIVDDSIVVYHFHHGVALQLLGNFDAAKARYEHAIRMQPVYADAYNNLAFIHFTSAAFDKAEACFRQVLEWIPNAAEVHSNLGNTLGAQLKYNEAVEAYDRAIALQPRYPDAWYNRGNALVELDQLSAAVESYRSAIRLDPNYVKAHNNMGNVLMLMGRIDEAKTTFEDVLRIDPTYVDALSNLAGAHQGSGNSAAAGEARAAVLAIDPTHISAFSNTMMMLQYQPNSVDERIACAHRFGEMIDREDAVPPIPHDLSPKRKLRIGYVSANLCHHPVGFLMTRVLAAHDKDRFDIYCYMSGSRRDDTARRIYDDCTQWRVIFPLSDDQAAAMIRSDDVDILVDLDGHTGGNRLGVFTMRPAPIQVSWLGYMGTTGLSAMDYILMDEATVPRVEHEWFSEEIVRLPYGRFCYEAMSGTPDEAPPPCLENGFITFGSFNNPTKYNADVIALWCRVLLVVPNSRMLIKWRSLQDAGGLRDKLMGWFADGGVDGSRVELRGWSNHEDTMREYADVDIALDPFPFSGGLTSMEALWMGVPVITLPGVQPASRQTLSMLQVIGLLGTIATSEDHYVSIAINLAGDLDGLRLRREVQRDKMEASPMCDGELFTGALEVVYREMWWHYVGRGSKSIAGARSKPTGLSK